MNSIYISEEEKRLTWKRLRELGIEPKLVEETFEPKWEKEVVVTPQVMEFPSEYSFQIVTKRIGIYVRRNFHLSPVPPTPNAN